jgi:hypothetical protein
MKLASTAAYSVFIVIEAADKRLNGLIFLRSVVPLAHQAKPLPIDASGEIP